MRKNWLNSKESAPDWVFWCGYLLCIILVSLTFSSLEMFFILCALPLIFFLIGSILLEKSKKIEKEILDKINRNITIVRIIECDILQICKGSKNRMHLNPPSFNFTGKIQEYWDAEKKDMRYETSFKNGQEHGNWCGWHKNGQLAYKQKYKIMGYLNMGCIHGTTQVWDKSGKLLAELHYDKGKLIYK